MVEVAANQAAKKRAPGYRARARHQKARMLQQREKAAQVSAWIKRFGKPGFGRLQREELSQLLLHLYPEAGPPDPSVLDLLIIQATEVRTFSIHLKGDPNGAVGHNMLMPLVSAYSMYLFASVAFDRRAVDGVVALRDLPALMRDANQGMPCVEREIDFVMDCCSSSVAPGMAFDQASVLARDDVLPTLQVMAMKISSGDSTGPTAGDEGGGQGMDPIGEFGEFGAQFGDENHDGSNHDGSTDGSTGRHDDEMKLTDIEEEEAVAREWDDFAPHLARFRNRQVRAERIQASIRKMSAVRFLSRCKAAATTVQSAARRKWARREVQRRRQAAYRIGQVAKGARSRRLARRRRDAAITIGRVAKGRVTRTLLNKMADGARSASSMVPYRMVVSRSRTIGDFFGAKSKALATPAPARASLSRANTAPVHGREHADRSRHESSGSRACIVS